MKMTKHLLSLIGAAAMTMTAGAVTITLDKVQQRYPWNNLVDIDYTLDGDVSDSAIFNVKFTINGTDYTAATFKQAFGRTAGKHRVTWDAQADKVSVFSKDATVALTITIEGEKDYNAVVFDLVNNTYYKTNVVDTVENWMGFAQDDTFKTDKLVMRLIPAKTFVMVGTNDWGQLPPRTVTVSSFMLGIFEFTQGQYKNIVGTDFTACNAAYRGATKPVQTFSWNSMRCSNTSTYDYKWPSMGHQVAANSVLGKLRAKFSDANVEFDLPTEAQWQSGASGKTGSSAYFGEIGGYEMANGTTQNAEGYTLNDYVVSSLNSGNTVNAVGTKRPNSLGLFDTIGGVFEFVLNQAIQGQQDGNSDSVQVDPVGWDLDETTATYNRARRGGGWDWSPAAGVTSLGARACNAPSGAPGNVGFRLASPILAD